MVFDLHLSSIFSPTQHLTKKKIALSYSGVLQEGRMIRELIEVVSEREDMEIHFSGSGPLERFIQNKSTYYDSVHYHGELSYEKRLHLQKRCDVLTALYDPETLNYVYAAPNTMYEALMLHKPLIMVKHTGLDSIVSSNGFGKVIDYNTSSLKAALTQLSSEKHTFLKISRKMKKYYNTQFSWLDIEKRILVLYHGMEENNEEDYGCLWNETRGYKDVPISKRSTF